MVLVSPVIFIAELPEVTLFFMFVLLFTSAPNWEKSFRITKRRGSMHTVWFALIFGGFICVSAFSITQLIAIAFKEVAWYVPAIIQPVRTALVVGAAALFASLTHIIGDTITAGAGKPTVRPFWPISRTPIQYNLLRDGSELLRSLLYIVIGVVVLLYMYKLGLKVAV